MLGRAVALIKPADHFLKLLNSSQFGDRQQPSTLHLILKRDLAWIGRLGKNRMKR